jgi:hypothetical protein
MNIGIGLGLCRLQIGGSGAPPTGQWILITGAWADAGEWDDSDTWNDGA